MLFLFNDVLIELGDPRDRLINSGCPITYNALQAMTPPQILSLVRSALYQLPSFPRDRREKAIALAALVSIKTGANAMLCLRTPQVAEPAQMPVRLAQVTLPILADLARREREGALTPSVIDEVVWSAA